jgi:dsRNA-specific ribonuclease
MGRRRPALLCATFEALVSHLPAGEIRGVARFINPLLEESADGLLLQPDIYDAKSRLQSGRRQTNWEYPGTRQDRQVLTMQKHLVDVL